MASTNKTAHYEFPQYIGSDIPNILTDINPAFETIDTALYEQGQQIAEQTTDLSDIQEAVEQATADVAVMQSSIVAMGGILETTRQLATDNKETIGQGTLDTTAQTLIGAVNELNGKTYETMAEVTADGVKTYSQILDEIGSAFFATHTPDEGVFALLETTAAGVNALYSERSCVGDTTNTLETTYEYVGSNYVLMITMVIKATSSARSKCRIEASSSTFTDESSAVPTSGRTFKLIKM